MNGNCLELPNDANGERLKERVKQKAYPCIERGGVVFTYMGPKEQQPAFPELEWANLPEGHVYVSKRLQDCHWLQGLEGDIDSARRNGSIVLYDSMQTEVARWNFVNGWPSVWKGADLDAGANEVAVEEVTIAHEGLVRA